MRIEDSYSNEITSMSAWAELYDTPRQKHQWKKHRSAYSTAEFFIQRNGSKIIQSRISEALSERIHLERATPEYEVRFDKYGHGRIHDMAIFGRTDSGASLFVGVEAKVDEPFGATVHDSYLKSKAKQIVGKSTNAPQRIENLLTQHFSKPDISMFDIRYQLLYATAGTLAVEADISILYVLVFKTPLYNELIGAENYRDYIKFMTLTGAVPMGSVSNKAEVHKVLLNEQTLTCIHEYIEQ